MLWDCPAYSSIRSVFMLELRRELGDRFEHFQGLDSFVKSSGSEANYAPHRLRSLHVICCLHNLAC